MVLPGQFLERPALVSCGPFTLEGLFHRGDRSPALLVCPPRGAGAGMDAPPVAELAWAAARGGHPSLRFQHRGTGASSGTASPDLASALDDALSALAHLAESAGVPRLAIAGVASGCDTALALARATSHASALVLAAPERPPDVGGLAPPVLVLLPSTGGLSPADVAPADHVRIQVVDGADARFVRGLPALGRAAVAFLDAAARSR